MTELTIFATVGTDHHPFDRLVDWVDAAHRDDRFPSFFIQSGTSRAPVEAPGVAYLGFDEMTARMKQSVAVVSHGGPATIIQARQLGLLPIVVPRRSKFGEHVDDHQARFARRLGQIGDVVLVEDQAEFDAALERLLVDEDAFKLDREQTGHQLAAVAEFERHVNDLMARRLARRR